jgi:uncharacterized protein YcfL
MKKEGISISFVLMLTLVLLAGCSTTPETTTLTEIKTLTITSTPPVQTITATKTVTSSVVSISTVTATFSATPSATKSTSVTTTQSTSSSGIDVQVLLEGETLGMHAEVTETQITSEGIIVKGFGSSTMLFPFTMRIKAEFYDSSDTLLETISETAPSPDGQPAEFEIFYATDQPDKVKKIIIRAGR